MINNRQGGRRGRGRNNNGGGGGGPRPQNGAPRAEGGNRIDNRSRGNAAQLHEKYKTLARDTQMQGDRVMTEYYLQFADHYFRILNETRARFEEQRRPRDDGYAQGPYGTDLDDDGEDDDGDDIAEDRTADPRVPEMRVQDGRGQDGRGQDGRTQEPRTRDRVGDGRMADNGERQPRFDARGERQPRDDGRGELRAEQPVRDDQRAERPASADRASGEIRAQRAPAEARGDRRPRGERPMVAQESGYRDDEAGDDAGAGNGSARNERGGQRASRGYDDGRAANGAARGDASAGDDSALAAAPANGAVSRKGGDAPRVVAAGRKPPERPLEERIDLAALPPSLAPAERDGADDTEATGEDAAPRRRRRRTKAEMEAARAAAAAGDVAA